MRTNKFSLIIYLLSTIITLSCSKDKDPKPYTDPNDGLYDLYLYDVINNKTTRITSIRNSSEHSYSISPDSKKVLYSNENGLNEMNLDGSGNRVLAANSSFACYSPDGKKIAFIDNGKLNLINVDGSNKIQISRNSLNLWYTAWSRDGEKILCSSDSGLCIFSLNGEIKVFSSSKSSGWYDWSFDSKEVYYTKFLNYTQVFKINLLQNKEFQVTNNNLYNHEPKCNPTKNEILFTSAGSGNVPFLTISEGDGTNQKIIANYSRIQYPCWSPNGDKIAFVTQNSDLALIDRNGENYKVINEIPGACMNPVWSSDGNYILYYRAILYL